MFSSQALLMDLNMWQCSQCQLNDCKNWRTTRTSCIVWYHICVCQKSSIKTKCMLLRNRLSTSWKPSKRGGKRKQRDLFKSQCIQTCAPWISSKKLDIVNMTNYEDSIFVSLYAIRHNNITCSYNLRIWLHGSVAVLWCLKNLSCCWYWLTWF